MSHFIIINPQTIGIVKNSLVTYCFLLGALDKKKIINNIL